MFYIKRIETPDIGFHESNHTVTMNLCFLLEFENGAGAISAINLCVPYSQVTSVPQNKISCKGSELPSFMVDNIC